MSTLSKEIMPIPQGQYIPATRHGNIVYTSGMTPRSNGELILKGKVNAAEAPDKYKEAVRLAAANALAAARNVLASKKCVMVTGLM